MFADRLINEIVQVVQTDPRTPRDWEFVAKIAVLVASGEFPEADLASALQSIRNSGKTAIKYFVGCMNKAMDANGRLLGVELGRVYLPEALKYRSVDEV